MSKKTASKNQQDKTTTLTFLNQRLATFNPNTPPPTQTPSPEPVDPTTPTTSTIDSEKSSSKRKRTTIIDSDSESITPSSKSTKSPRTNDAALTKQKNSLTLKKQECKKYRAYRVERGTEKATIGGKKYVESVKLINEVLEQVGDKQEVKVIDSQVLKQGRKIRLYGVESERVVIGLSVPVSGHKYTVYTINKEGKIQPFALDDLIDFSNTTTTTEEEEEMKVAADMWWKSLERQVLSPKSEAAPATPQRRLKPDDSNNGLSILLTHLSQEISHLAARVSSLEQEFIKQSKLREEAHTAQIKFVLENNLEMIRAFNKA